MRERPKAEETLVIVGPWDWHKLRNRAQPLAEALARRGVRVFYVNPDEKRWALDSLPARLLWALAPGDRARVRVAPGSVPGLRIVDVVSTGARPRSLLTMDYSPAGQSTLATFLRKLRRRSGSLRLLVTRQLRFSAVHAVAWDGIVLDIEDPWPERAWAQQAFSRIAIRKAVACADLVVANGEKIAATMQGATPKCIHPFANGVDAEFLRALGAPGAGGARVGAERDRYRVVFTGVVDSRIHFDVLAEVLPEFDGIEFVFIGDRVIPRHAEAAWNRLAGAANCRFLPPVPYREMPAVLREADGLLLPYAREGGDKMFPAKLLEYVAVARPIFTPLDHAETAPVSCVMRTYRDAAQLREHLRHAIRTGFCLAEEERSVCWRFVSQNTWDQRADALCRLWMRDTSVP